MDPIKSHEQAAAYGLYLSIVAPNDEVANMVLEGAEELCSSLRRDKVYAATALASIAASMTTSAESCFPPESFPEVLPPLQVIHRKLERAGVECLCAKCDAA